jgi:alkaline phosphatase D
MRRRKPETSPEPHLDRRRVLRLFGAAAATPVLFGACADAGLLADGEFGPDAGPVPEPVGSLEPFAAGEAVLRAGPMVGAVTPSSAKLWALASAAGTITARYRKQGTTTWTTTALAAQSQAHFTGHFSIPNLAAATRYEYQVQVGSGAWSPLSSFRTAPPATPGKLRFAWGSCTSIGDDPTQPSWQLLREEAPDFYLHVGDTVYYPSPPDDPVWQDPDLFIAKAWTQHVRQRTIPSFAAFMRNVPMLSTWSDHDYGPNNSGRLMSGGRDGHPAESMQIWKQIWANPSYGTSSVPGVFFKFSWRNVDFFVLDGRWYKDGGPSGTDKGTQIFGAGQMDWLIAGLRASSAPFKFIAADVPSAAWSWGVKDRDRLAHAIAEFHIRGVLILSGDPHRVSLHDSNAWGVKPPYVITDAVSSGIGIVLKPPTRGYGIYEIDTSLANPTAVVRLVAGNGATSLSQTGTWDLVATRTIHASDLKGAGW